MNVKVERSDCFSPIVAFVNNITGYRYVAGAAHMSKANVLSSEAGAVAGSDYQQTVPSLMAVSA
jgi:hypothetical protein